MIDDIYDTNTTFMSLVVIETTKKDGDIYIYIPHKDYLVPWLPGSGKYGEQPHSSVGSLVVECGDFGFLNFWVAMENGNVK